MLTRHTHQQKSNWTAILEIQSKEINNSPQQRKCINNYVGVSETSTFPKQPTFLKPTDLSRKRQTFRKIVVLFGGYSLLQGWNFCTKLWDACRFRFLQNLEDKIVLLLNLHSILDATILLALRDLTAQRETLLADCNFSGALLALQRFFCDDYCD